MEKEKFLGSLIGCAVGDAIGEMAFLYPKKELLCRKIEEAEKLIYTDDTAMAIAIARSLIKEGDIHEEKLGMELMEEFKKEPWRGYASGPPAVFRMVIQEGISFYEAAKRLYSGEGSYGNGAAMRIAPVSLFFHSLPSEKFYEKAMLSARLTHAHPLGIDGAAVQARAIAIAFQMDPEDEFPKKDFIEELILFSKTDKIKEKLILVKELIEKDVPEDVSASLLGKSVAVHESMPFAIYSFLKYPKSFKRCLLCAILNGGDRDTLGAMACSISGAYLGIGRIPEKWMKKLENFELIKELSERLYEVHNEYCRIR